MQTLTIKQVPQQAQQIHSLRYRKSLLESQRTTIQPIVGNKSSMIRKDQKTLNTILKRCEKVQNQSQEFIDELKLCQLIDGIKLYEESRLSKQLEDLAETKPHLLRELVHEKHIQRVNKFAEQREVYEDHKYGIADPSRLAARYEKRLFFGEHIKTNDFGQKKHVVNS